MAVFDPYDVTIQTGAGTPAVTCTSGVCTPTGSSSILTVANLQAALAGGNVEINTGSGGADTGNITVANSITWSTANRLTLDAYKSIIINNGVTITNSYGASLTGATLPVLLALRADASGINNGGSVTNNGTIDFSASTGAVSIFTDNTSYGGTGYINNGTVSTNSSWVAPTNASVSSQVTSYNLINTVADLAAIGSNATTLGYNYAIGQNINGGGAAFNGNTPIGTVANFFSGILDGQYCALSGGANCSVTGLTMNASANTVNVGLFGASSGSLRNFTLGMDITQAYTGTAAIQVGTLTANNNGIIANVNTTGNVTFSYVNAPTSGAIYVGEMVGAEYLGTTLNSTSSGTVNFTSLYNGSTAFNIGIGGMVGDNTTGGLVSGSSSSTAVNYVFQDANYATASTTNSYYIGGLVGANLGVSNITNSSASGAVSASYATGYSSGKIAAFVGGLAGTNSNTISGSYATGNVSSSLSNASQYVGGLVGASSAPTSSISDSYATGNVNYTFVGTAGTTSYVGGLVGQVSSGATLAGSYTQTGTVTVTGQNGAAVNSSFFVGGLVGQLGSTSAITNTGTISHASEAVVYIDKNSQGSTNSTYIGGLVGINLSTATNTIAANDYATGNVAAQYATGYSGNVTGYIGGLVGQTGNSDASGVFSGTSGNFIYATGNVTSTLGGGSEQVGGLIGNGASSGTFAYTYATGNVSYVGPTTANVGGLIGRTFAGSTVNLSHASGNVSNT